MQLLVQDLAPAQYQPVHYQYIMPEDQQRQVLAAVNEIKKGDTVDQVVARLGPPLHDHLLSPKMSNRPPIRAVDYYFATRNLTGSNEFDPSIQIFFNSQNRLENLVSNIPGISNINWPPGATSQPDGSK
jgi:hypothetical protein